MFGGSESNLPISGGLLVAGVLYAGLSAFATGPVVGSRTIAASDWSSTCTSLLRRELTASEPDPAPIPDLDCHSTIGALFGQQGQALCNLHSDVLKMPFLDQIQKQRLRITELKRKRLSLALSETSTRCSCAVSLTLEQQRIPLAIYAGSARLVTPPTVRNLQTTLMNALRSPHCATKG